MPARRSMRARLLMWVAILAVFAALTGVWALSRSRDMQLFGGLVSRIDTTEKVVALTFDDGPTDRHAPGVLALLREKGVRATFFLIGADMEKHPEQARAIVADGHELGNHTFTHPNMTLANVEQARAQIEPTDALIRAAGHRGEILFRPPYGKKLVGLPLYLARHDRTTVMWDIEPESHRDIAADPEKIARHVVERARPGSIIILHVMYDAGEPSRRALPAIIDGLHAAGYRIAPVGEVMGLR